MVPAMGRVSATSDSIERSVAHRDGAPLRSLQRRHVVLTSATALRSHNILTFHEHDVGIAFATEAGQERRIPRGGQSTPTGDQDMPRLIPIAAAMGALMLGACAHTDRGTTKEEYRADVSRAERDYKQAKERCDEAYSGNAEDICKAEAKADRAQAEASANAAYRGTPKARYNERLAAAEADYKVAKERCDDLAGDDKDVCLKDAKAVFARERADARTEYKSSN